VLKDHSENSGGEEEEAKAKDEENDE